MYEVTIPLRNVQANEIPSNPDDYYKIIQEEYASRFLETLGIASTAANKAAVLRNKPLNDCEVSGIWAEGESHSSVAEAIKISPPLSIRLGDDGLAGIHRHVEHVAVQPPKVVTYGVLQFDDYSLNKNSGGGGAAAISGRPAIQKELGQEADGLAAELERVRQRAGLGGRDVGQRAGCKTAGNMDSESRALLLQELGRLKQKFISPFACYRRTKEGENIYTSWPSEGPLDLQIPAKLAPDARGHLEVSFEDVRRSCHIWVNESMPLEMLIGRRSAEELTRVRKILCDPSVAQLVGLVAHLFYWVSMGSQRLPGEKCISQAGIRKILVNVHELWVGLSKPHRADIFGVNSVLPCLMLTVKQGVERCLVMQYTKLLEDEIMNDKVATTINIICMRLFDPNDQLSRFGKGDASGKAILISRHLEKLSTQGGAAKALHKVKKMNCCSTFVQSVLSTSEGRAKRPEAARTRAILHKSGKPTLSLAASPVMPALPTSSPASSPRAPDRPRSMRTARAEMTRPTQPEADSSPLPKVSLKAQVTAR